MKHIPTIIIKKFNLLNTWNSLKSFAYFFSYIYRQGPCINGVPPRKNAPENYSGNGRGRSQPPKESRLPSEITSVTAHIRCMFDNTSGVLVVSEETPDQLCYFELDDLNVEQPIALVRNWFLDFSDRLTPWRFTISFRTFLCFLVWKPPNS